MVGTYIKCNFFNDPGSFIYVLNFELLNVQCTLLNNKIHFKMNILAFYTYNDLETDTISDSVQKLFSL